MALVSLSGTAGAAANTAMSAMPAAGGKPKLEKAYLALMAPSAPGGGGGGGGGMMAGLGAAAGGALGGGATGGQIGAMADNLLGVGGGAGGGGGLGQITFKFNPKEYSIQKSANWQSAPQRGAAQAPIPQFTGSGPRTMSLEIFLDDTESANGSVLKDIELLFQCCTPTQASLAANAPSPPFVLFGWGPTMSFLAYVKSVSVKYSLFKPDGTPIRATGTVSLEEIPLNMPRQNPTSGGLAAHRTHTVVAGDTLASIAYREYRNPAYWRALARANNIEDPMRLPSGTRLMVPAPEEAAPFA